MMHKARKIFALVMIISLIGLSLVGCGGATDNDGKDAGEAGPSEQVLHYYITDEPVLDPQAGQYNYEFEVMNNIYEGLLRVGKNQEYENALAEKVTTSEDGLIWTFNIREAKWSDGSPITAQDFVYGITRATSEELSSIYAFIIDDYVQKVEATDDKTLVITLKNPTPYFESLLTFATYYPVKQEFVEQAGESFGKDLNSLLFSGPFKVVAWDQDQRLVFEKNENYWDAGNVKLEQITLDIIKDSSSALNLYLSGDLDRVGLSRDNVNAYKDDPQYAAEYTSEPDPTIFYLMFNTKTDILQNANIRKALSYGFDRENYVNIILNNGSLPAYGFVPPALPGPEGKTFREANGELVTTDLKRAEEFLKAGLAELGLSKLPALRYLGYDTETGVKGSEFIKDMYRKLGVDIVIENLPAAAVKEKRKTGDFDLFFGGWGPDYWDPMTFMDLFVSGGTFNEGKYSNARYDEIINFGKTTNDFKARMDQMLEAEKILVQEDAGIAPIYFKGTARLTKPYVKDFISHNFGAESSWKWTYIEGK